MAYQSREPLDQKQAMYW